MSTKYHANPVVAAHSTRPGESLEYVGTRNTTELLPAVFQTTVNKKFLDSTLEQLLSSGSMQAISYYIGNTIGKKVDESFLTDSREADNYQFVPGAVVRDDNRNITSAMSYDDMLDMLKYNEVDTVNTNRIFNEPGYTLDLPINYDMFINYHHYFWLLDFMPICVIEPTASDPISPTNFTGLPYYTTPTLTNGKQLPFQNGMRVRFTGSNFTQSGDVIKNDIYIIDGVGTSITLTKQFEYAASQSNYGKRVWNNSTIYGVQEPSQWDGSDTAFVYPSYDLTTYDVLSRDYVVEQRHSVDQSAWSRRNLWIHEEVVGIICEFNGLTASDYTLDKFRGVRPIIEFRANIEKYNHGSNSLGSVTHIIDNVADPATTIVGALNWNMAFDITTNWTNTGYDYGQNVRVAQNGTIAYYNCIKTHTVAKNPTFGENNIYWARIDVRNLQNNDTILFLDSTNSTYNNRIFRVSASSGVVTALTEIYGASSTTLNVGDCINVLIGYNNVFGESYPNKIYGGSEWHWDGSAWVYSQQKTYRSEGIKFKLYDSNSIALDNTTVYPNNNFLGDTIFNYGTSSSSTEDLALGFAPRYEDYGNEPGLSFDMGLGSVRYAYNVINTQDTPENKSASGSIEIPGYYYYKKLVSNNYYNGWSEIRNSQPVSKHIQYITDNTTPFIVPIGTNDISADNRFLVSKRGVNTEFYSYKTGLSQLTRINGVNPALFIDRNKSYTFKTNFDVFDLSFTKTNGATLTGSGVTVTLLGNNQVSVTADNTFLDAAIKYRLVGTQVTGLIYINSNSISDNITVTKNGVAFTNYTIQNNSVNVNSGFSAGDIFDIVWSTYDNVTQGNNIASDTHILNSQNELLTTVSFGDILSHMKSQMNGIPGLYGNWFGVNNYRNLPEVHEFGGTIRQQPYSTELLAQSLMHNDTNIYSSLKFASSSYANFKKQFLQKCKQLHNTSDTSIPVHVIVDTALEKMNVGKNKNDLFANSNMLKYKDYEEETYVFISTDTPVFSIPKTINTYDDTSNHVQVFIREGDGGTGTVWRSAVKDQDYTISDNKVTITASITFDSNGGAAAKVRWYSLSTNSFVPPSAVKLGLIDSYIPKALVTGIYGHDGSVTPRKGTELYRRNVSGFNIEDAVLYDLETRIYNNLNNTSTVDYKKLMPNASNPNPYTWTDLTNALRSSFNKWKIKENVTSIHDASLYSAGDAFTWNYKDVAPNIGGWRGIYTYYFNTTRPHTHPWEMFGYTQKPTWWDTNYSWTDAAKRTALITALKTGHYNDPALPALYDPVYAYTAYDWDTNTLVTLLGALNDPVTANVVSTPSNPAAEFVFGDWGTIENTWRTSSEYQISLFVGLAKLRPLRVMNDYFRSSTRTTFYFNTVQVAFSDTKWLGNNRNISLTNEEYEDNIVEYVTVKNGGSGYSSAPNLTVYGNFGNGAELQATVEGGAITAVKVTNPGRSYQTRPNIVAASGSATFEAMLSSGNVKYVNGLSNAIVNYAQRNGTKVTTLTSRLNNYSLNPIIKAGGFINNNQEVILESSQNKGRVNIPEENINTILYTSQPKEELFLSAVKVTKVATGYSIAGYDNSKQYFEYNRPRTDQDRIIVNVGNSQVNKYRNYETTKTILDYNTVLTSIQEVYNFILGYGHYLNKQGWVSSWQSTGGDTVIWSETATTNAVFYAIPNSRLIEINETKNGYFSNIANRFDGEYNVVNKNGLQLLNNKLIITRDVMNNETGKTSIEAIDNTEIYGLRLYRVEVEHALIIDKESNFDDLIYNPALGLRHKRVIWRGSRTKKWNGKLFAPGYIVNENSVIPNFDTVAGEIDKYYGPSNTLSNQQQVDAARFNIGYNKPEWNDTLGLDDDTLFNFIKGTQKYRGTKHALNAFMRNTALFGTLSTAKVHEEWAIRVADYGDTRTQNTLEFAMNTELLKTNPQPVRFSATELNDVLSDIVIDVDFNSPLVVTGKPGSNFTTRPAKTYNYTSISQENIYANDFISAGLPLLSEADYRVLNKQDFEVFPEKARADYSFDGEWQDINQWDNKTAYKFKDKVIYAGRVWEMLDPDGTSGLTRPNDVISKTATVNLPVIPSSGETLIIDGNTINLQQTQSTSTYGLIEVTGTQDISSTASVVDNSTLILGSTSSDARTITFDSTTTSTTFNDINIVGDVISPQIEGSATSTLIIDGSTVNFNQTETLSSNITAQTAFEQMFFDAFETSVNTPAIRASVATARVQRIEAFRTAYIAATSQASWDTLLTNYFANSPVGLEFSVLLALDTGTPPAYQTELHALITNDVDLVNNSIGTTYNAVDVIAGTDVVTPANISSAQADLDDSALPEAIRDWLQSNSGTTFTTGTIVSTTSGTVFKTYNLTEIIDRINTASISNVTASSSNNRLVITKTTTTPTSSFTLTISVGTANAEVGFSTVGTTTETSSGTIISNSPNLTLTQVINAINNANITNVSASAGGANNNVLKITSSNPTLYIGSGSANSAIGLGVGVETAPVTTTNISSSTDLSAIIDIINAAAIAGIGASNSNNRLKLTSTNSTMVIGAGTANSTVGLTAETLSATQTEISNVFNAFVGSDGNQVFQQMEYDPNVFSIWVADDKPDVGFGYGVYQTMDFGMYITKACAGINDADDAQITIALADSNTQAHNLTVGDHVLIRGSNTVPSIDGIHQVTSTATNNLTFYINEFIQEEGNVGNVYPIRNVRFADFTTLDNNYNLQVDGVFKFNFSGLRQNNQQTPKLAFVDDDGTGSPAVYRYSGSYTNNTGHTGTEGWVKVRSTQPQSRNDLIDNVKLYDANTRSLISQLEVFDPAKGIIPGFINDEIDFILTSDIASYNYNTIDGYHENPHMWDQAQVGTRWWDIKTSVYVDYEQSNIDYKQANWGRLFDGATIDVYEWTRSTVLPEEWSELVSRNGYIDGLPATGEPFSVIIDGEVVYRWVEDQYYNTKTKRTEVAYYFWVKNKLNSLGQHNYNTYQLAQLLSDPTGFGISWVAAAGDSELILANVEQYITDNTVVQINQTVDSNALPLSEWTLLSENDPTSIIPEQLHIKMRDSLTGYNRHTERYTYTTWNNSAVYNKDVVVLEGGAGFYINLVQGNTNIQPSTDTDQSHWSRLYDYSLPEGTPEADIDINRPHALPDLNLHPYNRYGHLVRPRQSLVRELPIARQNFIEAANKLLADINIVEEINEWDRVLNSTYVEGITTYDISGYWHYVDYVRRTYDTNDNLLYEYDVTSTPLYTATNKTALYQNPLPYSNGDTLKITDVMHTDGINRPEIYSRIDGKWVLEYKEKSTIQLSEELWNNEKFGLGFDLSGFDTGGFDAAVDGALSKIIDELKNSIFINRHQVKYNKLWFKFLYQAIVDNTADDFAFKTTFVKLNVEHPLLTAKEKYGNYSVNVIEDFFNTIKPFHTKLHSTADRNTYIESWETAVTEHDRKMDITMKYGDLRSTRIWAGDTVLEGGTFTTAPDNVDAITFTTVDGDIEYIYDANVFQQSTKEGWGAEFLPMDVHENISVLVQTNASGSTETSDTRSFRMNIWETYRLYESSVIVDTTKTFLALGCTATDTTIQLNQIFASMPAGGGVVWIGTERIEYGAYEGGNLRYCKRGTRGTAAQAHAINAVVNYEPRVPILDNFGHYGDNLRLAYNDSGVSLASAGTSTEHAFIRNAGSGSI